MPDLHALLPSAGMLRRIEPLPSGAVAAVWDGNGAVPDAGSGATFWVPPFLAGPAISQAVTSLPELAVVQLMTAGADAFVGRLPGGVTLCDARGVHTSATSEWAAAVLLAAARELPGFVLAQQRREWAFHVTGELAGTRVLVVGAGAIGEGLRARLLPFDVEVTMVARRARDGVHSMDDLPDLLPGADAVVVIVPLTDATRGLVDAAFLRRMKDGALLVNAARGPVVDTDALLAELQNGRLRAALDVTDPEPLPADHPLWLVDGLLLTPHVAGSVRGFPDRAAALITAQLRRFAAGEPLENVVSDGY
ncbi:MAG: 2-hydroxyacid dehydrogenase [Mycobacteriales bacterium]